MAGETGEQGGAGPPPSAVSAALRSLLWVSGPSDVRRAAISLVTRLGGRVIELADPDAHADALDLDCSFGEGPPLRPAAPPGSEARRVLEQHLPAFIRDGHRAVELLRQRQQLAADAWTDPLTGLANRRSLARALGRLRPGDAVVVIDLDHFKQVNDDHGHREGDRVLAAFGRLLSEAVRARDYASRFGGDEFVVILGDDEDPVDADAFLTRLRRQWQRARPYPLSFSAGVAWVDRRDPDPMASADEAMYRAKQAGRDRWERSGR